MTTCAVKSHITIRKPDIKAALLSFANLVADEGARLYAVGGFVRDNLLGFSPVDTDVCSALSPGQVIGICERQGIHYVPTGIEFGTVRVHLPLRSGELVVEHTTFRSDTYAPDCGHCPTGVEFTRSMEQDAFRRDFTVNALYADILTGNVSDPTGRGISDLRRRIIRATSPDPDIIMRDDGLRIMRMVRFACELGFGLDLRTLNAARRHVDKLSTISSERIRDELSKILLSDTSRRLTRKTALSPVLRGLLLLQGMDVFAQIIPELELTRGYRQKRKYHRYDVQTHMLHTASCTPPRLHMRLAGLLHDIGKPAAHKLNEGKNMHGHDRLSVPIAKEVLTRLRFPRELCDKVCRLICVHMYDVAGCAKEANVRAKFARMGKRATLDLIEFRRADLRGSGAKHCGEEDSAERFMCIYSAMLAEGAPFSYFELKVTGGDIMRALKIPPCPLVGTIKFELLRHCAMYPSDNNPQTLLELAAQIAEREIEREQSERMEKGRGSE